MSLLKLIATTRESHLEYNAQRWLRDSGFDPQNFDRSSLADAERDTVETGLMVFQRWLAKHRHDPGQLLLATNTWDTPLSTTNSAKQTALPFHWPANLFLLGITITVTLLILRGLARH